jgi:4-amino-4-deoxy-L-arabinose transferase-like glycosyltransferase
MKPGGIPAGAARNAPLLLTVAGLLFYVWFCVASLNKPLVFDEIDYGASAVAVAQAGIPVYYEGEFPEKYTAPVTWWIFKATPYPMYEWGLWHSPLYVYCLGLCYKILGPANWVARLFGAILFLISGALLCDISRMLFPPDKGRQVIGVFSFLYLTNPLLVQQGMLIDCDSTVVPLTCWFFLHEFIRLEKKGEGRLAKFAWLGVVLAIAYWAKEFAGIYLGMAVLTYYILRRQWRDCLGTMAMVIGGTILFWGSWWLFSTLLHMPANYFLDYTASKLSRGEGVIFSYLHAGGLGQALLIVGCSVLYIAAWSSPFYLALALIAFSWRLWLAWKRGKPDLLDALLIYVVVVFGAADVYRPSGMVLRYADTMYALILLAIAAFVCEAGIVAKPWQWLTAGFLALGLAITQVLLFGDPLLTLYQQGIAALSDTGFWWFFAVVAIILVSISPLLLPKAKLPGLVAVALLMGLVGFSFAQDWEQSGPYVTAYNYVCYGEKGHDEMAAYMASVVKPDEMPICRKDFSPWQTRKFGASSPRWYLESVVNNVTSREELVQNITAPNVQHILLDKFLFPADRLAIIEQYYVLDRQIGDYYLLRRIKPPVTSQ